MSLFPIFIVFDSVSCYPSCSLSHTIIHKKNVTQFCWIQTLPTLFPWIEMVLIPPHIWVDPCSNITQKIYSHMLHKSGKTVRHSMAKSAEWIVYIFNYSINIVSNWISWFWALKPLKMLSLARSFGCIARFCD